MKQIGLDASGWVTTDDFFVALLAELEAPGWHGYNLNALWDSITSDINEVMPPFKVVVRNTGKVGDDIATLLDSVSAVFGDARSERGLDVWFTYA